MRVFTHLVTSPLSLQSHQGHRSSQLAETSCRSISDPESMGWTGHNKLPVSHPFQSTEHSGQSETACNSIDLHTQVHAPPITAVGLRLSYEAVRIAVAHRLGCKACEPHTCMWEGCRWTWAACTLLPQKLPRQQRHRHLNDILWRAIKRAHIPAVKEPVSLMLNDNKRPDWTTLHSHKWF